MRRWLFHAHHRYRPVFKISNIDKRLSMAEVVTLFCKIRMIYYKKNTKKQGDLDDAREITAV